MRALSFSILPFLRFGEPVDGQRESLRAGRVTRLAAREMTRWLVDGRCLAAADREGRRVTALIVLKFRCTGLARHIHATHFAIKTRRGPTELSRLRHRIRKTSKGLERAPPLPLQLAQTESVAERSGSHVLLLYAARAPFSIRTSKSADDI